MPVFGAYETVGQLSPTPFGSVYKAKQTGSAAGTNFIIKTFSPLGVDEAELKRHPEVKRFLGSAELQKLVAGSNSKHWAPVHDLGVSPEGAYYVSTFYPTSASRLIKGKTKLGADDFYELTQAIVAGLVELRECCRRSHGNLHGSTILLPRMDATGYGQAMLAEPLAADSTKAASEKADLAALGRVLYELVMHKPYNVAGAWPIPDSPEWARLGRRGGAWREFCNKLLSSDPADVMTLETAQAEVAKLKPKKAPVPIWAVAAGVAVVGIGVGLFAFFHFRPDPNFKNEWVQLVDAYPTWFRMFAEDGLRAQLPDEYNATKEMVEKAKKEKNLELDPRDLSGKRDLDEQRNNPPATRDGMAKAKQAFALAKAVQTQMMDKIGAPAPDDLDAKKLPEALAAKVRGYAKEYEKQGWKGAAQELARVADTPENESGGDYINRQVSLLRELPTLKAFEGDWPVVADWMKQVTDPNDVVFRQFPAFVQRRVNADAGGNKVTTREIAIKIRELRAEFESDKKFWPEFFQFVSGPLKNEVNRQELAKTDVYARFSQQSPPQLQEVDLETWLTEAKKYLNLKEEHPAFSSKFTALTGSVKRDFDDLKVRYERKKEPPPQEIMDAFTKREAEVAKLREMKWLSGTRADVEGRVGDANLRLTELDEEIRRAIAATERTDPLNVTALVAALKSRTFATAAAAGRWEQLKTKWGLQNITKLNSDMANPKDFEEFKKSTRIAEENLRTVEKALAERLDLSSVLRNSDWNRALAEVLKRMDEGVQGQNLRGGLGLLNGDQILIVNPVLQLELDKLRQNYDKWKDDARQFVAGANLLEDHLDAGYGLGDAKSPVASSYGNLARNSFWGNVEVKTAMVQLTSRYDALVLLRRENRPATLTEKVGNSLDPSVVVDAWQRLHSEDVNWPATPEDLDVYPRLRQRLGAVIESRPKSAEAAALVKQRQEALTNELEQQGPRMWRRFMLARRSAADVVPALKKGMDEQVKKDFGVPSDISKVQPPLPAAVLFNIVVLENKPKMRLLDDKLDDKKAQDEARRLRDLVPTGAGADAGKLRASLDELVKDTGGGGAAAMKDVGPLSKLAQGVANWKAGGTDDAPEFTWTTANEKVHKLTFRRLDGAVEADGKKGAPYFLSTTEMKYALFRGLMVQLKLDPPALGLPPGEAKLGPQVWVNRGGGAEMKVPLVWLRSHTQLFPDYPDGLGENGQRLPAADRNPMETMPMQYVPPEAALYVARMLGCRLPTYGEWRFAASTFRPSIPPNLRDATWAKQLKHVLALRDANLTPQYPDSGMFKSPVVPFAKEAKAIAWNGELLRKAGMVGVQDDDGYLWLRPVQSGPEFSDLVGNVAEIVFDDPAKLETLQDNTFDGVSRFLGENEGKLSVVGGSAISAPEFELGPHPLAVKTSYADVGFRLAFAAGHRSIVDRLKDLMEKQDYVAVGGATTAPAN